MRLEQWRAKLWTRVKVCVGRTNLGRTKGVEEWGRAGGRKSSDLTFVPPRTGPGGSSLLMALGPLQQPSPAPLPLVPGIMHQACPLHSPSLYASVPSSCSLLAPTCHPHVKSCLFTRAHLIPRWHSFLTVLPKQLGLCLSGFSGSHQHHRLECLYGVWVCVHSLGLFLV